MTNDFALNHDKSLQINFICVKHQAKNDFLKDVESTVVFVNLDSESDYIVPSNLNPLFLAHLSYAQDELL